MPSRTRAAAALGRRHPITVALLALLALPIRASADPPVAHHPGVWTPAQYWPGTSTGVQAVHLMLLRGDTLFARPHSNLLAWGSWEPTLPQNGGLWGWKPSTDIGTDALANLTKRTLGPPPYNVFCAAHTTIPSATAGDGLLISGLDRNIAGTEQSVRFLHQSGEWGPVAKLNARRYYGVGTAIPWGGTGGPTGDDWRILASAGIMYDHMAVFGGRSSAGNVLTSDVERYQVTFIGGWDQPVTGSGSNWPVPREYHTLAAQGSGPHFLFGGRGESNALRSDFWQLKHNDLRVNDAVQTYEWTGTQANEGIPTIAEDAFVGKPSARWRHVAVVDPGSGVDASKSTMYLFGGEDQAGPKGDLWKLWWDGNAIPPVWKWSLLSPTGPSPGARVGATAVWDEKDNRLVLFGGEGANGALADNEVYVLDSPGSSPTWRVASRASGSAVPATRALHGIGADAERRTPPGGSNAWFHAMIFGGDLESGTGVTPTNELWELFVEPGAGSAHWQPRTPAGAAPAARTGASVIVCERYPQSAIVLGGELAGGGGDTSVWEIPLSSGDWSPRPPLAHALRGQTAIRDLEPATALRPEVYDATTNTWTSWGPLKYQASYHMAFAAAGALWFPGPGFWGEEKTWRLDLDAASPQWSQPSVIGHGFNQPFDQCATGVLYRPNKILKVGEIDNALYKYATGPGGSLVDRYRALPLSAALDLGESPLRWRAPADTLALARMFHSLSVLPNGEVIATAGMGLDLERDGDPEDDAPRRRPEIWDPEYVQGETRGCWYGARAPGVLLAEEPYGRGHHSAALLLPDGRVVSGGGDDVDPLTQIRSVDLYSPPYLYRADGSAAFRPRLYGAQDHIAWGGTFEVACPDSVHAACLIRPGAVTHTFNQDQRYVPLTLAQSQPPAGGHRVLLNAPANAAEAPPGNYLLFVLRTDDVSGKLVPSIARWVNVGAVQTSYATYDTLPPQAVGTLQWLPGTTTTSATLRWLAPADAGEGSALRSARYELRYRDGTAMPTLEEFFTSGTPVSGLPSPQAAGQLEEFTVTGLSELAAGVRRYFRLLSRDNAGSDRNWSALSNETYQEQPAGCPFVDTETAAGWQEENSILGRSLTGALALDGYRLRHAPAPEQGRIRLRLREDEQELTTLDQLRLIAIDHVPGVRAYALGDEVLLGTRVPAARVTTQSGLDVTALLDGSGEGFLGRPGDTLVVDLGLQPAAPAGALGARSVNSEHTVIIDDGGGKGGGGTPLLWREPGRLSASAVDAQILGSTGIRIETQDETGAWQLLAQRYPREHPDEAAYEPPGHGGLRLVFVGEHRLRFAGRLERSGEPFTAAKLPLLEATHTRLGDVAAAVDTTGNLTTELAAGDTLNLAFGWSETPTGQERELLLLSRGVYTANLPARGEEAGEAPPKFAFHGARPNPFTGTTALRFALPQAAHVRLEVLDPQGRRVALLANDRFAAGEHALTWDARTPARVRVEPGVYFYRFAAGEHRAQGKVVLTP